MKLGLGSGQWETPRIVHSSTSMPAVAVQRQQQRQRCPAVVFRGSGHRVRPTREQVFVGRKRRFLGNHRQGRELLAGGEEAQQPEDGHAPHTVPSMPAAG